MKLNVRKIVKILIAILSLLFPDNHKEGDGSRGGKDAQD
jgi:hypothetical protein